MYQLTTESQTKILHTLTEGCSLRSTTRLTGHHRNTITRLLLKAGQKAELLHNSKIRDIQPNHIQIDEAWTFVGKKNKNFSINDIGDKSIGTQFVFVAMDRETKLILAYKLENVSLIRLFLL